MKFNEYLTEKKKKYLYQKEIDEWNKIQNEINKFWGHDGIIRKWADKVHKKVQKVGMHNSIRNENLYPDIKKTIAKIENGFKELNSSLLHINPSSYTVTEPAKDDK